MGRFGWMKEWHGFSVGKSHIDALWSVGSPVGEVLVGFPSRSGGVKGTFVIAVGTSRGANLWLWIGDRRLEGDERLRPSLFVVR